MSSYSRNTNTAAPAAGASATLRRFPDGMMHPVDSKFCKVCYDAGHPFADYTDHFVKDQPGPDGKVVCPTLLNQACRICAKTGHTSSYCPERRPHRDEPRREEPRREEPRREEPRREEPRREERYIPRESEYQRVRREEPRREERYIPRESEHARDRRDISFNVLREDTERRERDIRNRDDSYHRQQDRQSKPWLQAALKPAPAAASAAVTRRAPYAHPHGPRVRLNLEAPALSAASTTTTADVVAPAAAIDVRKVNLQTKAKWGDEDNEQPFLFEFFNGLTTEKEDKLIAVSDNQNRLPWACSDDEN
jgi:Nanos RNA binding domain